MVHPGFSSLYTRQPLTMAMIIAFAFGVALMLGLAVTNPSWGSKMTHSVRAFLSHNGAVLRPTAGGRWRLRAASC